MVYVADSHRGRGVGRELLRGLISAAGKSGIWTLQSVMFPENEASVSLHRSCGFRVVGRRERLGQLGDIWRDVLLMERRV
jgi:phosphinothricin acetyltransferase